MRDSDYAWGPRLEAEGTRFRLWAPAARQVALELDGGAPVVMTPEHDGWWETVKPAPAGTRYRFRVGDLAVPDPASRRQMGDVHGWSVVADAHAYRWRTRDWHGRAWEDAVIYEIHTGLWGGFRGVAARLDALTDLGITAIELMPAADFPGTRNWGYDGVLPFAPDESYGTPDDLQHLVDEAHARGLMVFLDAVYNHFGPDGNYLHLYAPGFFRRDAKTPWGAAIDFRKEPVRNFFIENAIYWLREFRMDGLRLDAVHAIEDRAFLAELARAVRAAFPAERNIHLVVENEDNDAALLDLYDAQWNDDLHHALHVLLTGESAGYYGDFTGDAAAKLARALGEGFVYQGEHSPHRGAPRGTPSAHLPAAKFVAFLQNHDQIGNRAFGERLTVLVSEAALRAAVALIMLCPQIPMLFMGEDTGSRAPFLYFTDHRDARLAQAVREGRRAEFAKFPQFADEASRARIADPNAAETFARSAPAPGNDAGRWRAHYKELIALRRREIVPRLEGAYGESAEAVGEKAVLVSWRMTDARLTIAVNLGDQAVPAALPSSAPIWGKARAEAIPPFSTLAWIEPS